MTHMIGRLSLSQPACRAHFLAHGVLAVLLDLCEPRDKEAMSRNTVLRDKLSSPAGLSTLVYAESGVAHVLLMCC